MWDQRSIFCFMPLLTALLLVTIAPAQDPTGRPQGASPRRSRPAPREKPKPAPEPITVILTVLTDPPMSDIYLNGEIRGTTNDEGKWQISKLPLGHYTIEARKTGYVPATRVFNAGLEAPTILIRLTPALDDVISQFDSHVEAGRLANARAVFEDLSARFPDRPEVVRMRRTLAERLRERVAPVIPRTLNNWRDITRGEMARALEAANDLAVLNKEEARAQAQAAYLRGLIALRDWLTGITADSSTGNGEQAAGLAGVKLDLERAVQLDENWSPAWYRLGRVLLLVGEAGAAEAAFVKATHLEPRWSPAYAGLGAAHYAGMKYKEAITAYEKAIELDRRSAPAYAGLGLARASKGETSAGMKDVQRAMELDPTSALPHLNLGIIYSLSKKNKDLKRAEEALKKAIQMNPQNLEFQNRIAEMLLFDVQNRMKKRK